MARNLHSLFRSARGSHFKESRRAAVKARSQRVRFRRKYASSVAKRTGAFALTAVTTAVVIAAVGTGVFYGYRFWATSPRLLIEKIEFSDTIPAKAQTTFPIKTGQNMLKIRPSVLENKLLKEFPELKSARVRRHWDKRLTVNAQRREPVAFVMRNEQPWGVDEKGVVFTPTPEQAAEKLPQIDAEGDNGGIKRLTDALLVLRRDSPNFYPLIKRLETDKMRRVRIVLWDGAAVHWDVFSTEKMVEETASVLKVLDQFQMKKAPAVLRVVKSDRIVIDDNWAQKKTPGGKIGKT